MKACLAATNLRLLLHRHQCFLESMHFLLGFFALGPQCENVFRQLSLALFHRFELDLRLGDRMLVMSNSRLLVLDRAPQRVCFTDQSVAGEDNIVDFTLPVLRLVDRAFLVELARD